MGSIIRWQLAQLATSMCFSSFILAVFGTPSSGGKLGTTSGGGGGTGLHRKRA